MLSAREIYVVQTAPKVIERCLLMTTDPGDLVLDPTCGSGTTAFVAEKWGRRWITCDTSRVAITLAKQRLMTASFDYYALRYPHEGLKGGFDYETVPHITLKRIANNPDIDTIYDEDHPKIAAALDDLNAALAATPPKPSSPRRACARASRWPSPRANPARMGGAIRLAGRLARSRRAPPSTPSTRPARRCSAAWTSRSPTMPSRRRSTTSRASTKPAAHHRAILGRGGARADRAVPGREHAAAEADETVARSGETSRQALWRDELLKTGVRGKGGAMLRFAEFETIRGCDIHASGSLPRRASASSSASAPSTRRWSSGRWSWRLERGADTAPVAQVHPVLRLHLRPGGREGHRRGELARRHAAQGADEHRPADRGPEEEARLEPVVLADGPAGCGAAQAQGRDVGGRGHGFDYFDPKAGDLVSGGKKQIAMWSLDVDYDNRSLMPHQVFFPMADAKDGWNRLRKTVRAELDEDLLEQFHGTVSLPFEAGEKRRIAVKIVDDRGIESLKIMPLEG